jgi:D-alanine-D-alanine ligase
VGVSKARNREELKTALQTAAKYDSKVLVEEFISGHEVEVAVLGNDHPIASVVGEVIAGAEFYDYDAKYHSTQSRTEIPANISPASAEKLREAAITVYQAMGCKGLSRVDFFLQEDGTVVFNEINTLPGFTSISMYPKLFEAAGVPGPALVAELIRLAMEG